MLRQKDASGILHLNNNNYFSPLNEIINIIILTIRDRLQRKCTSAQKHSVNLTRYLLADHLFA